MSRLLQDVTGELSKLPGIGRRTALRLAIHLLRMEPDSVSDMTRSIDRFRRDIKYCKLCNNLSDEEICPICADRERDHTTVCVVEQVADVLSIENTRQYRGLYHVLGGVISPMQGIAPSDLKIDLLIERIAQGTIREVILAISTSVEGETTLFYLLNRLRQYPQVKVTSIARGIDDNSRTDEPAGNRIGNSRPENPHLRQIQSNREYPKRIFAVVFPPGRHFTADRRNEAYRYRIPVFRPVPESGPAPA